MPRTFFAEYYFPHCRACAHIFFSNCNLSLPGSRPFALISFPRHFYSTIRMTNMTNMTSTPSSERLDAVCFSAKRKKERKKENKILRGFLSEKYHSHISHCDLVNGRALGLHFKLESSSKSAHFAISAVSSFCSPTWTCVHIFRQLRFTSVAFVI